MKVTYTRAYLQRLCEQALTNIENYRQKVNDYYGLVYEHKVIIHNCLPFYERWFTSGPADVRNPLWYKGLSSSQRFPLRKSAEEYVTLYSGWDDVELECRDILSAIEGSQQVLFELDYQLAANIKEANKL